ncbi:MAG TPA: hydrolase [Bacteroidetes bacterium]|nr:hydrolase [Bacteroidota bacterium]
MLFRRRTLALLLLASFSFCSFPGVGIAKKVKKKDYVPPVKLLQAFALKNEKITIDGRLDEPVWKKAAVTDHFIQQDPNEGKPATEKTDVRVAYDHDAIYVGVYAYDSHPDKIRGLLTRRDQDSPSDWVHISFDSYADKRTAFEFAVNPAGIKQDALWSDDTNRDENWDAVWDVATRIVSDGWIAEFRIPLSQLRFSNDSKKDWGFQVMRQINRNNEVDFWKHVPKDASAMVSLFGKLNGIHNLSSPRHIQVMPYWVALEEAAPKEKGNPFRTGRNFDSRIGGDLKYGVTSNLTLDLTINPDFGQVEADPSELNISAFESFFEEKRPFFVEGNNIFNYSIGIGDGDLGSETLFYSRRIGRSPHYYPNVPDGGFVDQPQQTSILGAGKLTGKTARGFSIGILEAVSREEKARIHSAGQEFREPVEPLTNYFVGRVQKDFRNGRTTIGGLITHVYRDIPTENLNFLNRRAVTGGLDLNHRWSEDHFFLNAKLMGSYVSGDAEAIREVQLSSARYFQRPDANYISYNPDRTSLGGFAASLFGGKMAGGNWRYGFFSLIRSPGFETNDIGFMRNADWIIAGLWGGYNQFKPGKIFRQYNLNYNGWHVANFGADRLSLGGNVNGFFQFLNYWNIRGNVNWETDQLDISLLRGGPAVKLPDHFNTNFGFNSDERKAISGGFNINYNFDGKGTRRLFFGPKINLRPSGRFNMSMFLGLNPSLDKRQYVDEIQDENGTHYILGELNRKTVFIVTRLNYTITPDLSIQFYGQPFFTAGSYSNFREVVNPREDRYDNRFQAYNYGGSPDFNFKQFRSNLVVRWEYSPGSILFLVWSQGRTSYENRGQFDFRRDFSTLFDVRSDNVFLLKINKWFSY